MISREIYEEVIFQAIAKGATTIAPDIRQGFDPGDNIGSNVPNFTYQFVPGDSLEVTYVAKGGGSECFGGTRHRVVAFADGVKGIEKFVIDSFVEATRSRRTPGPFRLRVYC